MSRYYRIEFEGGVVVNVTKTVADAQPRRAARVALSTARRRMAHLGTYRMAAAKAVADRDWADPISELDLDNSRTGS